jgi:hypothetical protein
MHVNNPALQKNGVLLTVWSRELEEKTILKLL